MVFLKTYSESAELCIYLHSKPVKYLYSTYLHILLEFLIILIIIPTKIPFTCSKQLERN